MGKFKSTSCPTDAPALAVYDDYLCDNGVQRPYTRVASNGVVTSQKYLDAAGTWVDIPAVLPSTMAWGLCPTQKPHTTSITMALSVGNNTVPHNLNLPTPFRFSYTAVDNANNTPVTLGAISSRTTNNFVVYSSEAMNVTFDIVGVNNQ